MKTICIVIFRLSVGGAERVCASLANHFAQIGYKVIIAVYDDTANSYDLHKNITIVSLKLPSNRRYRWLMGPWKLARLKPDVIISFLWDANILTSITHGIFRIPVILCERSR